MKEFFRKGVIYTFMTMSGLCFAGGVAVLASERSLKC